MHVKITFLNELFEDIKDKLKWDGKEKMIFILCHSSKGEDHIKLIPYSFVNPSEEDYECRSEGHVKVKKDFFSNVVNLAVSEQSDLIVAHIHPPSCRGEYSPVDKHYEPILMRHVADQVNGIHQASIVFSHDFSELDSWYFNRDLDKVLPVEKVLIVGKTGMKVFIPTGFEKGIGTKNKSDFAPIMDRTIKAYGQNAVQMLSQLDIGVVGASGLGSPIIEMLARYNFKSIMICDPDIIEETNLNRLVGATRDSIGMNKAEFDSDYVKRINPDVSVSAFAKSFYDEDVQKRFAHLDIIMGCLDSEARFSINRMALANLIPYFDMGAGVVRKGDKVEFKGGQIYSIVPGRSVCLECSGAYNGLKKNFWSLEKKDRERRQGYFEDSQVVTPLVSDLDFVIAGIGCHEMLSYVWGFSSDDNFKVYCDMAQHGFLASASSSKGCIYCRKDGCLGMGSKVAPLVPLEKELVTIEDIPDLYRGQEREFKISKDEDDACCDYKKDNVMEEIQSEEIPLLSHQGSQSERTTNKQFKIQPFLKSIHRFRKLLGFVDRFVSRKGDEVKPLKPLIEHEICMDSLKKVELITYDKSKIQSEMMCDDKKLKKNS